jgi:hypothetical protein
MLHAMAPEIRYRSSQEICATWGAVVIRICDGVRTEIDDLVRVQALFDELLEHHRAIGMLMVFTHETPLPTPATQRHAVSSMRQYNDKLVLSVAMLGLGFWANSFRVALDAIAGMLGHGTISISATAETAAQRLAMELIGIDPDALTVAFRQTWAELDRWRSPTAPS